MDKNRETQAINTPVESIDGSSSERVQAQSLIFKGTEIRIQSEHKFDIANFEELSESMSGITVCPQEEALALSPDGTLTYVPSEEIDIRYFEKDKELVLSGPISLFGNGSALTYTAGYMAECLRTSERSLLLVHSAAVYSSEVDQSYVFLGEKGSGKTTMALRLCHQYGYDLVGNDEVFIGLSDTRQLITDGGNAWFNVRETAIEADPYIKGLIQPTRSNIKPSWNNKTRVQPEELGIGKKSNECQIESLFHIRIDHAQNDVYAEEWVGVQRNLILHERIGRHITGQATPFQDDAGNYLGSLPAINLVRSNIVRAELVLAIIEKGITEIFAPSANSAVEYVVNRIRK